MYLFDHEIKDWETWGKVYTSREKFMPLVEKIFQNEGLVFSSMQNCKPGTNGVFRVGKYIIKIFVPLESGYDSIPDYKAELFAMERANEIGVSVPQLVAKGEIRDRYLFRYLIMDFVEGKTLGEIKGELSRKQKIDIGMRLHHVVNGWATACENFNEVEILKRTLSSKRWKDAPEGIKNAQAKYLNELGNENFVYVHGDLTEDNLIIGSDGTLSVIDFADSVCAPAVYEDMTIICDAFSFDRDFLKGYYGDISVEKLTDICIRAIVCHEYGYHVVKNVFGFVDNINDLEKRIKARLNA